MAEYTKSIISATLQDLRDVLLDVISELESQKMTMEQPTYHRNLAYGMAGIAKTFGCSPASAQRIKSSGAIDGAISQIGDLIVMDIDKALELTNLEAQKRKAQGRRQRYVITRNKD